VGTVQARISWAAEEDETVSNVADIAIPLVTGIGGLLIGAGFARVTSRNDQRRQQYAAGLSALDKLTASAEDASAAAEAQWRVVEIGNWLELDSVPVSNAFKVLVRETRASPALGSDAKVGEATSALHRGCPQIQYVEADPAILASSKNQEADLSAGVGWS
jgi:hypothetical protein